LAGAPGAPEADDGLDLDGVAQRLQARLESIEAQPAQRTVASRVAHASSAFSAAASGPEPGSGSGGMAGHDAYGAAIEDLNGQIDLLREQLEVAFDDIEGRIAAADARAGAAEEEARAASARAANVLYAVDDLVAQLTEATALGGPAGVERVREAVDELRRRLQAS
jgi:hypothetical protein